MRTVLLSILFGGLALFQIALGAVFPFFRYDLYFILLMALIGELVFARALFWGGWGGLLRDVFLSLPLGFSSTLFCLIALLSQIFASRPLLKWFTLYLVLVSYPGRLLLVTETFFREDRLLNALVLLFLLFVLRAFALKLKAFLMVDDSP